MFVYIEKKYCINSNIYTKVSDISADIIKDLSEYIGHTISRLLDVLQVRGIITKEDRAYVSNKLDADTWYKKTTLSDIFKQMFDGIENNKEKPDEN